MYLSNSMQRDRLLIIFNNLEICWYVLANASITLPNRINKKISVACKMVQINWTCTFITATVSNRPGLNSLLSRNMMLTTNKEKKKKSFWELGRAGQPSILVLILDKLDVTTALMQIWRTYILLALEWTKPNHMVLADHTAQPERERDIIPIFRNMEALFLKTEASLYNYCKHGEMPVRALTLVKHLRAKSNKLFSDKDLVLEQIPVVIK